MKKRGSAVLTSPDVLKAMLENRSLHSHTPWLDNVTIAMDPIELGLLLDALLRPGVQFYAEWGSGGSTTLLAWLLLTGQMAAGSRAVSVESSPDFISELRSQPLIPRAEQRLLLNYSHGDLGPVGLVGRPLGCAAKRFSPCPEVDPARYLSLARYGVPRFDVILVDGRYRMACLLEALRFAHSGTRVLLHDKQNYQDSYMRWFRLTQERRNMRVLRPRTLFQEMSVGERAEYERAVAAKRAQWS